MIIAGVLIETTPGRAPGVAAALTGRADLELCGGDGDHRLAGVWTAESGERLEALAEALIQDHEDVLGVFPTLVGDDAEGGRPPMKQLHG